MFQVGCGFNPGQFDRTVVKLQWQAIVYEPIWILGQQRNCLLVAYSMAHVCPMFDQARLPLIITDES